MKTKKKLLSALSIICAFAIIFGGVFAFFSDSALLSENTKVGKVDIDVEGGLFHSNALNNLNPGDNDPNVPEDYRSGSDHELSFKIDNLGNKSVVYRTVIEVSAIKKDNTVFTAEELGAIILSQKTNVTTVTTQDTIAPTDTGKQTEVTRLDATGYDDNKLIYIIGGNSARYALNGTGENAEIERYPFIQTSAIQTFDIGLDKDVSSKMFEGATITFNVIVQAMQYRNTGSDEWNNIFEQSYTTEGTPETTNPEFKPDPIPFAVYSADDGSLTFYNQYPIAETGKTYNGKTVSRVFTGFDTATYSVSDDNNYSSQYGAPWYSIRNDIKTVLVADEITPLSTQAWFYNLANCTKIDILKLNTSKVTSMENMFSRCTSLVDLDLSNLNTSNVTNMNRMFYQCSSIEKLNVESFDTSSATNMRAMFQACNALTELDVSNFITNNVTTMESMFSSCSILPVIDVSNFNTSQVINMRGMFASCDKVKFLDVSNWDTGNVQTMSVMFCCKELETLDLSNFNTQNVRYIDGMFQRCNKLQTVDLSNWNTSKVTDMTYFVNSCPLLTSLGNISNWDTSKVTNMSYAFYYAPELVVDCSQWDTSSVTNRGGFNLGSPKIVVPTWIN